MPSNAMMESFWARMQIELLNRQHWRTRLGLVNAIFEYLEDLFLTEKWRVAHQTGHAQSI